MPKPIQLTQVGSEQMTVSVDGELRQIGTQLAELKTLLDSQKTQTIQHAGNIYNIQHIDEANFGFLTGKKAFNQLLTRRVLEAMPPYAKAAARFAEKVKGRPNWEQTQQISDKAKEIMVYSFVGPIGIQLSKLMAIGKEALTDAKQKSYLRKCLHVAEYTLDLLGFALLSRLWDEQGKEAIDLPERVRYFVSHRLDYDSTSELNLRHRLELLASLCGYFRQRGLDLPLPELGDLLPQLKPGSVLWTSVEAMLTSEAKLRQEQYDLLTCYEAEQQLATFLEHFAFLCCYRMASIHEIGYREIRNSAPRFVHRYTALGIDNKAQKDAEQLLYIEDTTYTDAVMLYRGNDYRQGVNLFPFVIDYNALSFEPGAMISFFRAKRFEDDNLVYQFLENQETRLIEPQGLLSDDLAYHDVLMDPEQHKRLNQDLVVDGFAQARDTILNTISFDDL